MKISRFVVPAVLGLMWLSSARASRAATITWGPATTITGDGNIQNTGTKVGAFNIGAVGVGATTINGVTFDAFGVTARNSTTVGNFTLSNSNAGANLFAANTFFGSNVAPFSGLSANYQTLLSSGIDGDGAGDIILTMNGLTSGTKYSFQWWTNDAAYNDQTPSVVAASGGAVALDPNTANVAGGMGQFAIGTFTADSTSQAVTFSDANGNFPILNAFQLRNVATPEPSTYAMMALGLVALCVLGAKRKKNEGAS